jgi:hypothetical protein
MHRNIPRILGAIAVATVGLAAYAGVSAATPSPTTFYACMVHTKIIPGSITTDPSLTCGGGKWEGKGGDHAGGKWGGKGGGKGDGGTVVSWNSVGPQGPTGPMGAPGPTGATGATGATGSHGSSFITGSSGNSTSIGNNGGGCGGFIGVGNCAVSDGDVGQVVAVSGTLQNLYVHLSAAPGSGIHERWQIDVFHGGVTEGTAIGCNIDDLAVSCSDTTDSFSLTAGDLVTLEATETTLGGALTPAIVTWSVQVS